MEKELSFETECYNIYDVNHSNSVENIQSNSKSKTLSYLKITKDTNKSISKDNFKDFNDYYGYLIIDFHQKSVKNKDKAINRTENKNNSNNISSENSQTYRQKSRKNSNEKCQINTFFKVKDKKSTSKSKFAPAQPPKSKSKSLSNKFQKCNSKSNLKSSGQAAFEEKVFT